jgi:hypothetical protein
MKIIDLYSVLYDKIERFHHLPCFYEIEAKVEIGDKTYIIERVEVDITKEGNISTVFVAK